MHQYYTSQFYIVRGKWLKHEIYDTHGDLTCVATVKKTKGVNNTKIKDGAGANLLTLKRGLVDRDICAYGPDGELKYRLTLPKVMMGSTRRTFALKDPHENLIGEIILASALPAKSLLRERLEGFSNEDFLFKDEHELIFYSHKPRKENDDTGEKSLVQKLLPVAKLVAHLILSSKIGFLNGPKLDGRAYTVKHPNKADPAIMMLVNIFNAHIISQLDD